MIEGQVQYLGPPVPGVIGYSTIFWNGIHPHLYESIKACPAMAELFVPVAEVQHALKELNFDFAHNMRGSGRYATLYRAVEEWRDSKHKTTQANVTIKQE